MDDKVERIAETAAGLPDVSGLATGAGALLTVAEKLGADSRVTKPLRGRLEIAETVVKVGKATAAVGMGVTSATGLTVAATSGAGIASGLAAAGSVVGGGMAAGPAVLAAGPATLATMVLNRTVLGDSPEDTPDELRAKKFGRNAATTASAAGVLGTGVVVVAGGASGPAIMATLAGVGGVVGGGALAGVAVLAAGPAIAAVGLGLAIRSATRRGWFGGQQSSK